MLSLKNQQQRKTPDASLRLQDPKGHIFFKDRFQSNKTKRSSLLEFLPEYILTLKSKEIHAAVVGALKVCFHSVFMKVKHTFYFCCTSRIKFMPPFPKTISKQNHRKSVLKCLQATTFLIDFSWKTLFLPLFAQHVNIT